jgi:hypothetical protein
MQDAQKEDGEWPFARLKSRKKNERRQDLTMKFKSR